MNKKYIKKLRLKKEVKETLKNIMYYTLVMIGFIIMMILINIIENLTF